jgi:hypothetical protein
MKKNRLGSGKSPILGKYVNQVRPQNLPLTLKKRIVKEAVIIMARSIWYASTLNSRNLVYFKWRSVPDGVGLMNQQSPRSSDNHDEKSGPLTFVMFVCLQCGLLMYTCWARTSHLVRPASTRWRASRRARGRPPTYPGGRRDCCLTTREKR